MILSILLLASVPAASATQPKDACVLVTQAEVQAITPKLPVGTGTPSTLEPLGTLVCQYKWGTGNNAQSGRYELEISVTSVAKAYPGTSPTLIKQGLVGMIKPGAVDSAVVGGVGDAATYQSAAAIQSTAVALVKKMILTVSLTGPDGRAKRTQVIALLKAAAGRL